MLEIFERAPAPKLMVTLKRADHLHFMDDVEQAHDAFRTSKLDDQSLAEIQHDMEPATQLVSGAIAHAFTSGLCLAHFDAALRGSPAAWQFLESDLKQELFDRGIEAGIETHRLG